MWENTVEPDWSQITIWRMRMACGTFKTTNTHTHTPRTWNSCTLLLFHCNSGCTNGALVLSHTYIACLVTSLKIFVLTLNQSRLCLELRSSWTIRRIDWLIVIDNSKDRSAFIDNVDNKRTSFTADLPIVTRYWPVDATWTSSRLECLMLMRG